MANETRYISVAETAKLVRAALAEAFPGVTFSVRSRSYAGGASIDVRWTDGPTTKAVELVRAPYVGSDFDPMIDLSSPRYGTLNGQRVHYGAKYILCQRALSAETMTAAAHAVCTRYGIPMPEIRQEGDRSAYAHYEPSQEPRCGGQYGEWATTMIWRETQEMDLYRKPATTAKAVRKPSATHPARIAQRDPISLHQARIARQDARMPEPIRNVMSFQAGI